MNDKIQNERFSCVVSEFLAYKPQHVYAMNNCTHCVSVHSDIALVHTDV